MEYFDLGSYHRHVNTTSKEAQTWFNRGLIWSYGFNHDEAAVCFDKSLKFDPKCIMALWGIAYSLGPNYNKPWEMFDEDEIKSNTERSKSAIRQAIDIIASSSDSIP